MQKILMGKKDCSNKTEWRKKGGRERLAKAGGQAIRTQRKFTFLHAQDWKKTIFFGARAQEICYTIFQRDFPQKQ